MAAVQKPKSESDHVKEQLMSSARRLLHELDLPVDDRYDLPASTQRFSDGAHHRIEIPSVEGPVALAAVIAAAQQYGVTIHRASQGSGMMLLTDAELREMARLARSGAACLASPVGAEGVGVPQL